MNDKNEESGPAFPETRWDDVTRQEVQWTGMTLRDYFAGQSITAILSKMTPKDDPKMASVFAYAIADEMLKVRKK